MAITSYPFDNADTTEAQYSKLFRSLRSTGVIQSRTATSHTSSGQMIVAATTGMGLTVGTGQAIVRGHFVEITSPEALTVPAAGSVGRTDAVVLRLDPAANTILPAVITTSVAFDDFDTIPTLTQTDTGVYEMLLALVKVGPNVKTIAASSVLPNVTWAGKDVATWRNYQAPDTAHRVAPGTLGWNLDDKTWEYWDGASLKVLGGAVRGDDITSPQLLLGVGSALTADKVGGKRITVKQGTAPTSPAIGDVWISW